MLSRIDGHTSWGVLRQIGGLMPEEVDLALESWLQTGLVVLDDPATGAAEAETGSSAAEADAAQSAPTEAPAAPAGPPQIDDSAIDASLDLDVDLQKRILTMDATLGQATYHEILGIERGADNKQIKRAYFKLSKVYHPDRYFRRNIGEHATRLDRIFKHVMEAYELLSDPATRTEIERSMAQAPTSSETSAAPAADAKPAEKKQRPAGYKKPTRMENLQRLRNAFKMPEKMQEERRFKSRQFFEAARSAAEGKRWLEAAASARLAIAFDPWNRELKQEFASIQMEVNAVRAVDLIRSVEDGSETEGIADLLEEAVSYRPADPDINGRAAQQALRYGMLKPALEYAKSACELEPESGPYHLAQCRALRRLGKLEAAKRVLTVAGKLLPGDPEIAEERKLVRLGRKR
ncbi:MAG: DnaJ domain-containing protein [Myxococcota bacterium]